MLVSVSGPVIRQITVPRLLEQDLKPCKPVTQLLQKVVANHADRCVKRKLFLVRADSGKPEIIGQRFDHSLQAPSAVEDVTEIRLPAINYR